MHESLLDKTTKDIRKFRLIHVAMDQIANSSYLRRAVTGYFPNMLKIEKEWLEAHNKSLANGWSLISEDWVVLTLYFSFCLQTKNARFAFLAEVRCISILLTFFA